MNIQPKFSLGKIAATPAALEALADAGQTPDFFLQRHQSGDWGDLDAEDKHLNDQALQDGSRIFSAYKTLKSVKIWLITEAGDSLQRSLTTLLLPEDY